MKILVGDETGLIKYVSYEENKIICKFGEQKKDDSINFMEFIDETSEKEIVALTKQNVVKLFQMDANNTNNFCEIPSGSLQLDYEDLTVGFNRIPNSNKWALGNKKGEIFCMDYSANNLKFNEKQLLAKLSYENVNRMKLDPFETKNFMVLSKDTNPQIFDIESKKIIWKARNVKNDYLDLKVPINDLDVSFDPNKKNVYVSTAYNKIRIYDISKTNTQPLSDFHLPYEESPLNNILLSPCTHYLFVSNHIGSIFQLDLRKNFGLVAKMKGSTGTIKSMKFHSSLPFLAVASIDRYLRVYNLLRKKLTFKLYIGQRLTSLAFSKETLQKDCEIEDEEDLETVKPAETPRTQRANSGKNSKNSIKLAYLPDELPKVAKKIKKKR